MNISQYHCDIRSELVCAVGRSGDLLRNKAMVVAQGGRIDSQCGGDDWGW